jgi:hypothetical protein
VCYLCCCAVPQALNASSAKARLTFTPIERVDSELLQSLPEGSNNNLTKETSNAELNREISNLINSSLGVGAGAANSSSGNTNSSSGASIANSGSNVQSSALALEVGLEVGFKWREVLTPVPVRIAAMLTAQCDRLNSCQLMILKVSAYCLLNYL